MEKQNVTVRKDKLMLLYLNSLPLHKNVFVWLAALFGSYSYMDDGFDNWVDVNGV